MYTPKVNYQTRFVTNEKIVNPEMLTERMIKFSNGMRFRIGDDISFEDYNYDTNHLDRMIGRIDFIDDKSIVLSKVEINHCKIETNDPWIVSFFRIHNPNYVQKDNPYIIKEDEREEFVAKIIDIFESFLDDRKIIISNTEKEQEPDAANIYGTDYGELQTNLEDYFIRLQIMEGYNEYCPYN